MRGEGEGDMRAAVVRVGAAVGERGMCRGKVGEWLGCVDDVRAACVCICVCTNLPHLITPSLTSLAPMHPALQLPPHAQCPRCRPLPPPPHFPLPRRHRRRHPARVLFIECLIHRQGCRCPWRHGRFWQAAVCPRIRPSPLAPLPCYVQFPDCDFVLPRQRQQRGALRGGEQAHWMGWQMHGGDTCAAIATFPSISILNS